jgi:(2R)-sulfolactate sulfo-lyase subunit alpha
MASSPALTPGFLAHREGDSVAVAVTDLPVGTAEGGYLHGSRALTAALLEPIPLGHKFALQDLAEGDEVIEYGLRIAITTKPVRAGEHVHVHNVRSARWHNSVAS